MFSIDFAVAVFPNSEKQISQMQSMKRQALSTNRTKRDHFRGINRLEKPQRESFINLTI